MTLIGLLFVEICSDGEVERLDPRLPGGSMGLNLSYR